MTTLLHRIATVLFVLTFGLLFVAFIAYGNARQEEIDREHGEGEA